MNAEERRGGAVFDITDSHKDALNLQTPLNNDMAQVVSLLTLIRKQVFYPWVMLF